MITHCKLWLKVLWAYIEIRTSWGMQSHNESQNRCENRPCRKLFRWKTHQKLVKQNISFIWLFFEWTTNFVISNESEWMIQREIIWLATETAIQNRVQIQFWRSKKAHDLKLRAGFLPHPFLSLSCWVIKIEQYCTWLNVHYEQ